MRQSTLARLVVICGVDGSGKTTLLNRYVANLPEDTAYARFDETCKTGKQFYFEFLKQLGFDEISGTLNEFRNITREFLIYQGTAGNPVFFSWTTHTLLSHPFWSNFAGFRRPKSRSGES